MSSLTPFKFNYQKNEREFVQKAGNYISYNPVSGNSFRDGQNASIKISSNNAFLDPQKSYLSFDVITSGTNGNFSNAGGVSLIKDLSTTVSGRLIESLYNYNTLCAINNLHAPVTKKQALNVLEGANIANSTGASSAFATSGSRTVYHSPQHCLNNVVDSAIPLPFIPGGIQLDINFASLAEIACGSGLTGVTIANLAYNAYLTTPPPAITQGFDNSLKQGSTAYLKMPIVKSFTSKPVASTTNQHVANVGINDSVKSVLQVERLAANVASSTTDDFANFTNNNKASFFITNSNQKFPQNRSIACGNNQGSYKCSPENIMQALTATDNDYDAFSSLTDVQSTAGAPIENAEFLYYQFSPSNEFGSGVSSLDGQVILNTEYSTPPVGTEQVNTYVMIDGYLKIDPSLAVDYSTVGL